MSHQYSHPSQSIQNQPPKSHQVQSQTQSLHQTQISVPVTQQNFPQSSVHSNSSATNTLNRSEDIQPSSHRSLSNQSIWNTNGRTGTSLGLIMPSLPKSITGHSINSAFDDFAIEDDDDDDNLAYQEDFVPSSLTDLLTPQERQRRGSRPSSSDIWTSSPRLSISARKPSNFSDIAGSPLRQSYPAPIGTPDRTVLKPSYAAPIGSAPKQGLMRPVNNSNTGNSESPSEDDLVETANDFETQFHMEDDGEFAVPIEENIAVDTIHKKTNTELF